MNTTAGTVTSFQPGRLGAIKLQTVPSISLEHTGLQGHSLSALAGQKVNLCAWVCMKSKSVLPNLHSGFFHSIPFFFCSLILVGLLATKSAEGFCGFIFEKKKR